MTSIRKDPMEEISRRSMLRLAGGAAGASALLGASLVVGDDLLGSASAAPVKKVFARLEKKRYRAGEVMTLKLFERLAPGRRIRVTDTTGARWRRVARNGRLQKWQATATGRGPGKVTVHVLWPDGRVVRSKHYRARVHYHVDGPGATVLGAAVIGMSAPASQWDQRVREVGPGLAARRIYADLSQGATSQIKLVEQAHAAGMLPVISYKVGGDIAGAMSGKYNAVAEQAAAKLASFGLPTAVSFWHEPNPDVTGAEYAAASKQLLPIFRRGELRVGPILNGWLLDNREADFAAYCPDELFGLWDWFGIDTYESGTMANPGNNKPADRIPALRKFLSSRGHSLPLGVGEYNGFSAATIAAAGEALMSTPNVWFGCLWNSSGGKGVPLSGDRLAAFQRTLADPRSAAPRLSADDRRGV
jgi:hypothetical protein